MVRPQMLALLGLAACSPPPDDHVGNYVRHDDVGFTVLSLEHGGRFQLLMTDRTSKDGPFLVGGNYVVVGDTMYYKSDVALSRRVGAVALRGDSLFWGSGSDGEALLRERRR